MEEKKSMMSLSPCCDEVATSLLVLAVGTSRNVGSEGRLGDIEAKIIEH